MITEKFYKLARPYALAAFEYALDNHDLTSWEAALTTLAGVAENDSMKKLIHNPSIMQTQLSQIFCDVLGKNGDTEKKNFIQLLAEYERFMVLPAIAALFSHYRKEYEKTLTVELTSATALDAMMEKKFTDALTRRLKRKVILQWTVDESLLGGAVIRAGDRVIDGSVRGKLNRMLEFIE